MNKYLLLFLTIVIVALCITDYKLYVYRHEPEVAKDAQSCIAHGYYAWYDYNTTTKSEVLDGCSNAQTYVSH